MIGSDWLALIGKIPDEIAERALSLRACETHLRELVHCPGRALEASTATDNDIGKLNRIGSESCDALRNDSTAVLLGRRELCAN